MKLYVGMKIWKNTEKVSYYIIRDFNDEDVILQDPRDENTFECSTSIVMSHIKEVGLVSTWKVGYYGT